MTQVHPQTLPPPPRSPWRRAVPPLGLAAAIGAGCVYVALVNPNASSLYPQCPLKTMTGFDCPGCGVTRAVYSLLHLDVAGALSHNLLFVLALPFLVYALIVWGANQVGRKLPLFRWRSWMTVVGAVAVLCFAVARNLPPFEWLAAA